MRIITSAFLCKCCCGASNPIEIRPREQNFGVVAIISLLLVNIFGSMALASVVFYEGMDVCTIVSASVTIEVYVTIILFNWGDNCCAMKVEQELIARIILKTISEELN
mmetsp:Transcript_36389/g.62010  ORF Transcript_36389/g.62010 Transcript_36389/m.62010 type:complete len:108 (+) Transcript_36389:24-347(+)